MYLYVLVKTEKGRDMANIFMSYNREDEDKTKALVNDIEELGHDVWFDHELGGGQNWWDKILETIRNCDVFVFVLSADSLDSSACNLEYEYAHALGKTILPVLVGEGVSINLLPSALSKIQFVDYQKPDRDAILHLAKAFTTSPPSQPLPDPLPLSPEVPISYLGGLTKQIKSGSNLSYEEQSALLIDLKKGLKDPENTNDARTLLKELRKKRYLFANIAGEIDELLGNTIEDPKIQKVEHTSLKQSNSQKKRNFLLGFVLIIIVGVSLYYVDKFILNNDSTSAQQYADKGYALNELMRYNDAIEAFDKAISIDPSQALYYRGKGYALNGLMRYNDAIEAFDKAISIDPGQAWDYDKKGYALNGLKRYNDAIEAFDKAISIDPGQAQYYRNKGYALITLMRYNDAIKVFDKAISIDPGLAWDYDNKGYALNGLKRYNDAIEVFDKAISIDPGQAQYYRNKGYALNKLMRYNDAIEVFDKAISIDPGQAQYYNGKGYALQQLGRSDEAKAAYDKASRH